MADICEFTAIQITMYSPFYVQQMLLKFVHSEMHAMTLVSILSIMFLTPIYR